MRWGVLYFLVFITLLKTQGQGTFNVASGNMTNQTIEVHFVLGGDIINGVSNNTFSIIPSSIPVKEGFITEVAQVAHDDLIAYPNPFTKTLYLNRNSTVMAEILDSKGNLVKSVLVNGGALDVHDLSSGSYILRAYDDQNSYVLKVIKYEGH
ncbi:MAG: T9SS type A sorting domain-containing protein [Bacteroidetes bacterium]|nr:T9SS type A sorting domain-containing protein [Bacteroidota bacterium]